MVLNLKEAVPLDLESSSEGSELFLTPTAESRNASFQQEEEDCAVVEIEKKLFEEKENIEETKPKKFKDIAHLIEKERELAKAAAAAEDVAENR